jgi:hypothetical protein
MSWVDGHIERHRWSPDTIRPPVKGAAGGGFVPTKPGDYFWLREHASVRVNVTEVPRH